MRTSSCTTIRRRSDRKTSPALSDATGRLIACTSAVLVIATASACAVQRSSQEEPGLGEGPSAPPESVTFDPAATEKSSPDCRSRFAADDLAGFVQEFFAAVVVLQATVDANPIRQLASDPQGAGFEERAEAEECSARTMASFRTARDARTAGLAASMASLLTDAAAAERAAMRKFHTADWASHGTGESQARQWAEIRPSTSPLSARGAALVERVVALLREDGRATEGPGRLRIARDDRDVVLEHRGRLTDLTIMVERDVDPGGAMSTTARRVLKWLHHAHGLTYASQAP